MGQRAWWVLGRPQPQPPPRPSLPPTACSRTTQPPGPGAHLLAPPPPRAAPPPSPRLPADPRGPRFDAALRVELQKVAAFYVEKEEELAAAMARLSLASSPCQVAALRSELQDLRRFAVLNHYAVVKAAKKRNRHLQVQAAVGLLCCCGCVLVCARVCSCMCAQTAKQRGRQPSCEVTRDVHAWRGGRPRSEAIAWRGPTSTLLHCRRRRAARRGWWWCGRCTSSASSTSSPPPSWLL